MPNRHIFLNALHGHNQGRPPIWLMRQAGRYMPEYRALRQRYSFLEMCHQPELIAQVTKQPIDAFGMDAAIIFSDILIIPEALNVGLQFEDGKGPIIERPLHQASDIDLLPSIDIAESLQYLSKGVSLTKSMLQVPLIGFCGGPFTMASYMIEGGSSRTFRKTKHWLLRDPSSFHRLLSLLTKYACQCLEMQVAAGVDAIQIFDSWTNALGYTQLREFSLPYLELIIQRLKNKVPVIVYCRGSTGFISDLVKLAPNGISVDWNAHLADLRRQVPRTIALQGNLDPDVLFAPRSVIRKEALRLVESMRGDGAYIFNVGHGLAPDTPVEAVRTLVTCVQEEL